MQATHPVDDVAVQAGAAGPAPLRVKMVRGLLRTVLGTVFRLRVQGLRNVPRTPVIVCANHLGWTDAFLVLVLLPVQPRIYILGERDAVLRNRFRIWLARRYAVFVPLERDKPREALRIMTGVLARGGSLLIFPEGRLGTEEGTLGPLQHGAAHLSLHSGVPLLPVGLTGTRELWLRRPLTLRAGPPIDPGAFAAGDLRTRIQQMTAALDGGMRALLPGDTARPRRKPLRDWLTNLF